MANKYWLLLFFLPPCSKGEVELSFDMSEGGDGLNVEPLVMVSLYFLQVVQI